MRVVLAGGGTGGHIYPAVAVAEKILRREPDSEILFIGTERGMEKRIIPDLGYEIRFVSVRGFSRRNPLANIGVALELLKASGELDKLLRDFAPDVVVGTGGYVSGPVIRSARKAGFRTCIHEQNAKPGLANRMAERYADVIFVAFEEGRSGFKSRDKVIVSGNPIRREFVTAALADHRRALGVGENEFAILCFGGSRGAKAINETFSAILRELEGEGDTRVFFVTGEVYAEAARSAARASGAGERVKIMDYAADMHVYMAAADLVISRSGALTVSEITACRKAAILIPSPNVTANHQFYNAKALADRGGAVLLPEAELTPEKLCGTILRLKHNKAALNAMSAASGAAGRTDATDVIYERLRGANGGRHG